VDTAPLYLICGAPASGKSSAARAVAASFARGLHINVDHLRDMVVAGGVNPGASWSPALVEQLALARATAVEMAQRYRGAGFAVVIDDFWDPVSRLAEYASIMDAASGRRVILYPAQAKVHTQALARAGSAEAAAYLDEGIRAVYADLQRAAPALAASGWLLLDTTSETVATTVEKLRALAPNCDAGAH
jgi:predicted kinase